MKTARVLWILLLLPPVTGSPTWGAMRPPIVHSDGDFSPFDWTLTEVVAGGGGDATADVVGGGNPGAMVQIATTVNQNCSAIYAFLFNSAARYSPSVEGSIETLDYDEDARLIVGFGGGQATGLAIRQNGNLYVMAGAATGIDTFWHPIPVLGLKSTDFRRVLGGSCPGYVDDTQHPNFIDGPTIEFGFFRANSQIPPYPSYTIVAALDNWKVTIHPMSYVALGDSYSSGEGLWPYFSDVPFSGNECHRSDRAFGFQLGFPGVRLYPDSALACSGALTFNVVPWGFSPVNGLNEPPQLSRKFPAPNDAEFVVSQDTDMVTISIGGNNLGFAEILLLCADPDSDCTSDSYRKFVDQGDLRPFKQIVEARLDEVAADVAAVYTSILQQAPEATVYVLGYPRLFGGTCLAPFYSSSETLWLDELADAFQDRLVCKTSAAGIHFVPVSEEFAAHGVCSSASWLIKPQIHNSNPWVPINETGRFHPTAKGQKEYAAKLRRYMKDWIARDQPVRESGLPENPPPSIPPECAQLLHVEGTPSPSLGALRVLPDGIPPCETGSRFVADESIEVLGVGFASGATVTLRLESGGYGADFGTVSADVDGLLDAVATLPADAPTETEARILARGLGASGEARLLVASVGLSTSFEADADGDGVPDPCDSCPDVSSLDTADSDGDGVGDACDPCVGDTGNDADGDGLCAEVDPCPLDFENDADADGVCESDDNCPLLANMAQVDSDEDGAGDPCDAAPTDPGVHAVPGETGGLRFEGDGATLTWFSASASAGALTGYEVARGPLDGLAASYDATCIASGSFDATTTDSQSPAAGEGFWYLVRARNSLGVGTWGYASDLTERVTGACP